MCGERIASLFDAGVRTFVDLTEPGELDPYQPLLDRIAAERCLDLRRLSFPIPDGHVIADDGYDPILDAIERARDRGIVFVHCWGGVGRTTTVAGSVLVAGGLDADTTFARLDAVRSPTRKAGRAAPENERQRDVIRRRAGAG